MLDMSRPQNGLNELVLRMTEQVALIDIEDGLLNQVPCMEGGCLSLEHIDGDRKAKRRHVLVNGGLGISSD